MFAPHHLNPPSLEKDIIIPPISGIGYHDWHNTKTPHFRAFSGNLPVISRESGIRMRPPSCMGGGGVIYVT